MSAADDTTVTPKRFPWHDDLAAELAELAAQGLRRSLRTVCPDRNGWCQVDGRRCLNLASNDYLGLSQHPRITAAAADAVQRWGAGTGASRLVTGNSSLHEELEQELAALKGCAAAVVTPTGYAANLAAITAVLGSADTVVLDRLCHASIVDACRLSGARLRVYPHRDVTAAARALRRAGGARKLLITDGIFSMDGTVAPVAELFAVAGEAGAALLVDDAHATLVYGDGGSGTVHAASVPADAVIHVGTLSKAAGAQGGFVAGDPTLIDYLRHRGRSFVYTTGLAPAAAAAALAAVRLVREEPELRRQLWANVAQIRDSLVAAGVPLGPTDSHILTVPLGDPHRAQEVAARLFEQGVLCPAIRPPTVPRGTSRLRVAVTAVMNADDIDWAARMVAQTVGEML